MAGQRKSHLQMFFGIPGLMEMSWLSLWRLSMKVGDLIYDSHYGLHGLIVEVSMSGEFCTVFYEDGESDDSIHPWEESIRVISESR